MGESHHQHTQLKDSSLLTVKQIDEWLCSHDNSMMRRDVLLLFCHFLLSGLLLLTSSGKAQMGTITEKNPTDIRTPQKQATSQAFILNWLIVSVWNRDYEQFHALWATWWETNTEAARRYQEIAEQIQDDDKGTSRKVFSTDLSLLHFCGITKDPNAPLLPSKLVHSYLEMTCMLDSDLFK